MRRTALALAIGGCILFATRLQPFATSSPEGRASLSPPVSELERADAASEADQQVQVIAPAAAAVDAEAAKLRARLAAQPPYAEPARDPFRFSGAGKKVVPRATRFTPTTAETTPDVIRTPEISYPTLVAITADATDGGLIRSAALAMGDELAIVRPGQTFLHFFVRNIGPRSVDLVDLTAPISTVFTISLR